MEFLRKKEIKITSYVVLGVFLVFLVLNSCNPITMGQFASWNNAGNIILSLIRWISFIGIATLPLAIINNKDKYKQLSMYVVLPCLIISLCASGQYFSLYDISTFYVVIHYLYHIFGILLCLYILLTYDFRNTKFSAKNFFIIAPSLRGGIKIWGDQNFNHPKRGINGRRIGVTRSRISPAVMDSFPVEKITSITPKQIRENRHSQMPQSRSSLPRGDMRPHIPRRR